MKRILILRVTISLFICFYSNILTADPGSEDPPFDWYEAYLSEDAPLIINESNRSLGPHGTIITYTIKAEGFSPDDSFSLWKKNGSSFSEYKYKLEYQ